MKTLRKKIQRINFESSISPFSAVHIGSRLHINPAEIVMVQADINYSNIHLSNGKRLFVSTNIQKLEERFLPYFNIVRVHRSFLINTIYLMHIEGSNGFLTNNKQCLISRRKKINLLNLIQLNY